MGVTNSAEFEKARAKLKRRRKLTASTYLLLKHSEKRLPPIVRGLLGLLLTLLGMLGFLPILGFWMIPLGLALLATDLPPLRRWVKAQLGRSRRHHLSMKIALQPRTDSNG